MAKLFPVTQRFVDLRDGDIYCISKVKILTTTSDHLEIPNASDAAFVHADRTTSDPGFYFTGGSSTSRNRQINIDGATVGTEYTIVSRHLGRINFNKEDNRDT